MGQSQFEYIAFISYRHESISRKWALWLKSGIEGYLVPWSLVKLGKAPRRLGRCFRDEEELPASPDLSKTIDAALRASKFLIVICTPRTPHSRWVNEEVRRFRELGRGDQILALLVDGEPKESFPASLIEIRPSVANEQVVEAPIQQIEPLAADVREDIARSTGHGDRHLRSMAKLRIIAGMLGMSFDDLYNRDSRRSHGRTLAAASVSIVLTAGMAGLTVWALTERRAAVASVKEAQLQRDLANKAQDFLLEGVLAKVNPNSIPDAKELSIVKQRILDSASAAASEMNFAKHTRLEAEIHHTLARVYSQLDEKDRSFEEFIRAKTLAENIYSLDSKELNDILNNYARELRNRGRLAEAQSVYEQVLASDRRTRGDNEKDTITTMVNLGRALLEQDKLDQAERYYKEAYNRTVTANEPSDVAIRSNVIEGYARLLYKQKLYAEAIPLLRQVVQMRESADQFGPDHTDTLNAKYNLAVVLFEFGDSQAAEPLCRFVVEKRMVKLGDADRRTKGALRQYALILANVGANDEALALGQRFQFDVPRITTTQPATTLGPEIKNFVSKLTRPATTRP